MHALLARPRAVLLAHSATTLAMAQSSAGPRRPTLTLIVFGGYNLGGLHETHARAQRWACEERRQRWRERKAVKWQWWVARQAGEREGADCLSRGRGQELHPERPSGWGISRGPAGVPKHLRSDLVGRSRRGGWSRCGRAGTSSQTRGFGFEGRRGKADGRGASGRCTSSRTPVFGIRKAQRVGGHRRGGQEADYFVSHADVCPHPLRVYSLSSHSSIAACGIPKRLQSDLVGRSGRGDGR
jgi:hypothetical protein